MKIEKAEKTGFCSGVRRALEIVEKACKEQGNLETLGEVVHNRQVVQKLEGLGVSVAETVNDVKGNRLVISAHGVGPQVKEQLRTKQLDVIDATCPFVRRAQQAAKQLKEAGFFIELNEEWCSDKKSTGKMAKVENRCRSEFPLFLTFVAKKL